MKEAILLRFFIQGKLALFVLLLHNTMFTGGLYISLETTFIVGTWFCFILHEFYFHQILRHLSDKIGSLTTSFKFFFKFKTVASTTTHFVVQVF